MHCHRNRQAPTPAGERGTTPRSQSNGRRPVRGCSGQTSVAARLSFANDGQGGARNLPIRPVASGGDRTARTLPSYRRDWLPCQTRAPIAPAPDAPGGVALATSEHRPSSGGGERSANRLRTRCGRAYNRYGLFCQDCYAVMAAAQNKTKRCPGDALRGSVSARRGA